MKIGIVGLGLIGGSIGRSLVKKTSHTVYAYDSDSSAMLKGALLNAYCEPLTKENASDLDVLLICVYPASVPSVMDEYLPFLKKGAVLMDCAGVKRKICAYMEECHKKYPDIEFLGGHPMAGREFSGVEHSTASLMEKATCLLVPVHTDIDALCKIKELFLEIGAEGVVVTTADAHDKIIALTSQLAHVVSCAYVTAPNAKAHYGFSAGSFKDMTRVARLNPSMWTDLMTENADNLASEVRSLSARLDKIADALEKGDKTSLKAILSEANDTKLELENRKAKKLADVIH